MSAAALQGHVMVSFSSVKYTMARTQQHLPMYKIQYHNNVMYNKYLGYPCVCVCVWC